MKGCMNAVLPLVAPDDFIALVSPPLKLLTEEPEAAFQIPGYGLHSGTHPMVAHLSKGTEECIPEGLTINPQATRNS